MHYDRKMFYFTTSHDFLNSSSLYACIYEQQGILHVYACMWNCEKCINMSICIASGQKMMNGWYIYRLVGRWVVRNK